MPTLEKVAETFRAMSPDLPIPAKITEENMVDTTATPSSKPVSDAKVELSSNVVKATEKQTQKTTDAVADTPVTATAELPKPVKARPKRKTSPRTKSTDKTSAELQDSSTPVVSEEKSKPVKRSATKKAAPKAKPAKKEAIKETIKAETADETDKKDTKQSSKAPTRASNDPRKKPKPVSAVKVSTEVVTQQLENQVPVKAEAASPKSKPVKKAAPRASNDPRKKRPATKSTSAEKITKVPTDAEKVGQIGESEKENSPKA